MASVRYIRETTYFIGHTRVLLQCIFILSSMLLDVCWKIRDQACNIDPIQPGLGWRGDKVLAKTLSVHKFLNIKLAPPNMETFNIIHLRRICFDT